MQVTYRVLVPSTAFLNLLWVAATKATLFRGHFLINEVRTLVVGISCRCDSFPLNCSSIGLPWLTHGTCPFYWDALRGCLWCHAALLFCNLDWPRIGLSLAMLLGNLDFFHSSSGISSSSAWALGLVQSGPRWPNSLTPQ